MLPDIMQNFIPGSFLYKKLPIVIILTFPIELLAAPSDHGRIYQDNSPLSIVLGSVLFLIVLIGWISSKITSKTEKTHSENQQSTRSQSTLSSIQYIRCSECQGAGYRYKIVKSWEAPGEYIKCDCCKGYKHKLNDEAERLLIDYYHEYHKELDDEFNRREEVARRKREREVKKQQEKNKEEIIKEGRSVYSLNEYNDKIYDKILESSLKRNNLVKKLQELKQYLPTCDCNGENKQCSRCYGTSYVFNDELHTLMKIYQSSKEESEILTADCNRIYGEPRVALADFNNPQAIADFSNINQRIRLIHARSSQISKQIALIVDDMPICQECMGKGFLKVIGSEYKICEYHITVKAACLKCRGSRYIATPQ